MVNIFCRIMFWILFNKITLDMFVLPLLVLLQKKENWIIFSILFYSL